MRAADNPAMDAIDRTILGELIRDGRLSYRDLAARIRLSPTATAERVRRLTEAGVIAGECGAAKGVCAEEALRDSAVLFTGERHTPPLQIPDGFGRTLGDHLHRLRVGEQVALSERVGGVLLPGVIDIHGG